MNGARGDVEEEAAADSQYDESGERSQIPGADDLRTKIQVHDYASIKLLCFIHTDVHGVQALPEWF